MKTKAGAWVDLIGISILLLVVGLLAFGFIIMPPDGWAFLQQSGSSASAAPASVPAVDTSGAVCTGDATVWTVERCVWPDGLECVYGSRGGVSCNWDDRK